MKIPKGPMATLVAIVLLLLLAGCVTAPYDEGAGRESAVETKRLLSEAGFEMKMAQSPEELAYMNALTQWTIIPKVQGDTIQYEYADATYCKCLYVGTGVAYQRYLRLMREEKDARREEQARKWERTVNR
jgi:hypothetical protein